MSVIYAHKFEKLVASVNTIFEQEHTGIVTLMGHHKDGLLRDREIVIELDRDIMNSTSASSMKKIYELFSNNSLRGTTVEMDGIMTVHGWYSQNSQVVGARLQAQVSRLHITGEGKPPLSGLPSIPKINMFQKGGIRKALESQAGGASSQDSTTPSWLALTDGSSKASSKASSSTEPKAGAKAGPVRLKDARKTAGISAKTSPYSTRKGAKGKAKKADDEDEAPAAPLDNPKASTATNRASNISIVIDGPDHDNIDRATDDMSIVDEESESEDEFADDNFTRG